MTAFSLIFLIIRSSSGNITDPFINCSSQEIASPEMLFLLLNSQTVSPPLPIHIRLQFIFVSFNTVSMIFTSSSISSPIIKISEIIFKSFNFFKNCLISLETESIFFGCKRIFAEG
uniref:Putative secreted protein n=1 Tax=Panstrongylus lignarius TaxID=156445 RepID=A0A224XPV0_9HEMI